VAISLPAADETDCGVLGLANQLTGLIRGLSRDVLSQISYLACLVGDLPSVLRLAGRLLRLLLAASLLVLYFAHCFLPSFPVPVTPLTASADSIDGMDSIEAIESSQRLGRGRGSTPPLSILLITSLALRSAAFCRASMFPCTRLSAMSIRPSILRSANFWRRS
jgi:hypothetical protein